MCWSLLGGGSLCLLVFFDGWLLGWFCGDGFFGFLVLLSS